MARRRATVPARPAGNSAVAVAPAASAADEGVWCPSSRRGVSRRTAWLLVGIGGLIVVLLGLAGHRLWRGGRLTGGMAPAIPVLTARVKATLPHDRTSFTQGLAYRNGRFYEGTGLRGSSRLRIVEPTTARVLAEQRLDDRYFGEGVEVVGDSVYQLTWQERVGLIYDAATLARTGTFPLAGEGWGLTSDGKYLIVSDGSSRLSFLDPADGFRVARTVQVTADGRPISRLNELEMVGGEIWANVWYQDYLVRIDPATGRVVGYVNLRGLRPPETRSNADAVLNGIAFDAATGRLFITGKNWPAIYEIELIEPRR